MATFILTVAEYNAAQKPFNPQDTVVIADTGAVIGGLSYNECALLLVNNVDALNATDNVLALTTAQYNSLGSLSSDIGRVALSSDDFVFLRDWARALNFGTEEEIASLAVKGIDSIDSLDDTMTYFVDQYRALGPTGPVALTAQDFFTLAGSGKSLSTLTTAEIAGLAAKGVDVIDATDGAVILSSAQYAALGSFPIAPGDGLKINGSSLSETIVARSFDDTVKGFGGNDRLYGESGNDKLYAGGGRDSLYGGPGSDTFVFDTKASRANFDRIADFNVKDDAVWLDNKFFTKLGKGSETKPGKLKSEFFTIGETAKEADDYLIYSKKSGKLFYDSDGSGAGRPVEIAILKKGLKLTHHDFFAI